MCYVCLVYIVVCVCVCVVSGLVVAPSPAVEGRLVNPKAVRRHYDPNDLVSLAAQVCVYSIPATPSESGCNVQVQTADQFVRATTGGKLQVIVDQIRFLQKQV